VHAIYSKIKTINRLYIFLRYPCEFSLFFSLSFFFSRSFCSRYLLRFIFFLAAPQKILARLEMGLFIKYTIFTTIFLPNLKTFAMPECRRYLKPPIARIGLPYPYCPLIRDFKIHYGEMLLRLLWPRRTRLTMVFYPPVSND